MILAVPQQTRTVASGIGIPEYPTVITCWSWWCTACRIPSGPRWSHADLALRQGDHHVTAEQCHTVGQLELFALAGGAR
jgi:hypothetical protein